MCVLMNALQSIYSAMVLAGFCIDVQISEETPALFEIRQDRKSGFIDRGGNVVVEPKFDAAIPCFGGSYTARAAEQWFSVSIDKNGVTITPVACKRGTTMLEGIGGGLYRGRTKDFSWSIYDPEDRFQADCDDDCYLGVLYEGLLAIKQDGKWGFADRDGRIIIRPAYDLADIFSEGRAAICLNRRWGYIDRKGEMIVKPVFTFGCHFVNGLAVVNDADRFWFIKPDGTPAFDRKFNAAKGFSKEGLALAAESPEGPWGYIDSSGDYVIEPKYEEACGFSEGLAVVQYTVNSGSTTKEVRGYINPRGKLIIRVPGAKELHSFHNGLAFVRTEAWAGYINKQSWVWRSESTKFTRSPIEPLVIK